MNSEMTSSVNKEFIIDLPEGFDEHENYPLVILLSGDSVKPAIFHLLKRELILNNIGVITFTTDSTWSTIVDIFKVVSHIKNSSQLNKHPRGIIGHSHGAHYALLASLMIPDEFNFSICSNFGDYNRIRLDLNNFNDNFDFTNWRLVYNGEEKPYFSDVNQYILNNRAIPKESINNLLILASENDRAYQSFKESLAENYTQFWEVDKLNVIQGTFQNNSARYFFVEKSFFPHISGLYHPEFINLQLSWITSITGNRDQNSEDFVRNDLILNYFVFILFLSLIWPSFYYIFAALFAQKYVDREFTKDIESLTLLRISATGSNFDRSLEIERNYKTDPKIERSKYLNLQKINNPRLYNSLRALWMKIQIQQIVGYIFLIILIYAILDIFLLRWVIDIFDDNFIQDIFFVRSIPFDFGFYFLFLFSFIHDRNKTSSVFETKFKEKIKSKRILKGVGLFFLTGISALFTYLSLYQLINTEFIILTIMTLMNIFLFYVVIYKLNEVYSILIYMNRDRKKNVKFLLLTGFFFLIFLFYSPLLFSVQLFNFSILDLLFVNYLPILIITIRTFLGITQQNDLMSITFFNVGINIFRRIYLLISYLI